jgi:16S rRNA (guanine527-N7)-methyltransferase
VTASYETEPPYIEGLFGEQIDLVREFARSLAQFGVERGLIGPQELPRLWTRHLVNSVLLAPLLRPGRLADVGSGAGLPGLVLAIARPDVSVVLIEPMERRVEWLREQVAALGLPNATVLRSRAEEVSEKFDQVTARAVRGLRGLIPLTVPLLAAGGELLLMKGHNVQAEVDAAAKQIARFGLHVEVLLLGEEIGQSTRVVRAAMGDLPEGNSSAPGRGFT